jgi:hypothetical protein
MMKFSLEANKTYQILKAAEDGGYGVLAPVIYNVPNTISHGPGTDTDQYNRSSTS